MSFETDKERLKHEKSFKHHQCKYCDASFMKITELNSHRYECRELVCEACGRDFRKKEWRDKYPRPGEIFGKAKCK